MIELRVADKEAEQANEGMRFEASSRAKRMPNDRPKFQRRERRDEVAWVRAAVRAPIEAVVSDPIEAKSTEPTWRTVIHALVVHPSQAMFLARHNGADGWLLPCVQHSGRLWTGELASEVPAVGSAVDRPVRVLRWTHHVEDTTSRLVELGAVFELALRLAGEQTVVDDGSSTEVGSDTESGLVWRGRDILAELPSFQRRVAEGWLREVENPADRAADRVLRAPWARERETWYDDVTLWIDESLSALGRRRTSPLEQVKVWSISCVLRAWTDEGAVYFKSSIQQPLFVNEAVVTRMLGTLVPEIAPPLVATDDANGWLLMEDLGQTVREQTETGSTERRNASLELVRQAAAWQQVTSERIDEVLAAGCIDRRPSVLISQLGTLLDDPMSARAELETKAGEGWLRLVAARLGAICAELDELPIPSSLVHGDLHLGNVASREGGFSIFDWTDACVAHPFVDMNSIFFVKDEDQRNELRATYLDEWKEWASPKELLRAWGLGAVAFELHQVVTYVSIMHHVEPATWPDLWGALPDFLDRLAKALAALD